MIKIHLSDPGMLPKTVEADSWEDVPPALSDDSVVRYYTDALICDETGVRGFAKREVGERTWLVKERICK